MTRISFFIIIFLDCVHLYAQNQNLKDSFNYQIREAKGDINNDGISDMATISMDTLNDTKPLKLDIFLSQPDATSTLFFSSTNIIQAMYPTELNGEHNGSQIPYVYLDEGILLLAFDIDGNSEYKFKYKYGVFELTYFSHNHWDGKNSTETSFNLITGKYTKQSEILETSEITQTITGDILIKPLPKLKDFKPFQCKLY